MPKNTIDQLIINSPYEEPQEHWLYVRETQEFERKAGRRRAGYWRASARTVTNFDDPGEFVEIELVNRLRPRVQKWREAGYTNVTGVTRKLLEHWTDRGLREQPLFWCQLEAVETAIFLTEALPADRQGLEIMGDGSTWERQCLKLATGTGKTVVMAMLIAWQALNKIANSKDPRFSKHILIIAPGITVRDRLQVLKPSHEDNFYSKFELLDSSMWQDLQQAKIEVMNWHALAGLNENYGPKVVKKGPESDEAFVRRTLPDFGNATGILIINDEAHHCHRPTPDEDEEEKEEATEWVSAIDRIHQARGVLKAFDLTATPFKPTGMLNQEEQLFSWIVSDFGLNDAIESGLVKTPKVAVRDDAAAHAEDKTRFFHIYPHVKDDLNRRAEPHEDLPPLVINAVNLLGADWKQESDRWKGQTPPRDTPPVMIMICNRTETAARMEYSLQNGLLAIPELGDKGRLLRIDQNALDRLEAGEGDSAGGLGKDRILLEREKFNTVGKIGKLGAPIHCVIGVNMLSEGWDARTVTHILGLRAFTSQLLCEQVIGRGLRRISYELNEEGRFDPEYVTVFGVPFTFLPVEETAGIPRVEKPKTKIEPKLDRMDLEIKWPNVLRVERRLDYYLEFDLASVEKLVLSSADAPTTVETAPVIDGKPKFDQMETIDLESLDEEQRLESIKLRMAVQLQHELGKNWPGDIGHHIGELTNIIDRFIDSDRLEVVQPPAPDPVKMRIRLLALNMPKINKHISRCIRRLSRENPIPILDSVKPVLSTATSPVWYTTRPTQPIRRSQISHIVLDSGWEKVGYEFERNRIPGLIAWVKNDHLGFKIYYLWQGQVKAYYPDFLLRFEGDKYLILEVKGQTTEQDREKWQAASEWVEAVNASGQFGKWDFKTVTDPSRLFEVIG